MAKNWFPILLTDNLNLTSKKSTKNSWNVPKKYLNYAIKKYNFGKNCHQEWCGITCRLCCFLFLITTPLATWLLLRERSIIQTLAASYAPAEKTKEFLQMASRRRHDFSICFFVFWWFSKKLKLLKTPGAAPRRSVTPTVSQRDAESVSMTRQASPFLRDLIRLDNTIYPASSV